MRDAYLGFTGSVRTDLWLMLGDNAYPSGTDAEYQAAVFDVYPDVLRNTVLWPTIGNHDAISASSATQTGPYYDIFSLPKTGEAGGLASGTEAYYSFDYANVHFVVLDSQDTDRSPPPSGAMLTWLDDDLASTAQEWIVAYWHHPPYSDGSHESDTEIELIEMRQNALPILEDHGVDLVLTGHSHSYERSFLIDGHYGLSSTFGPSHVVDGGSGGREARTATTSSPAAGPARRRGLHGRRQRRLDHPVEPAAPGDVLLHEHARLGGPGHRCGPSGRPHGRLDGRGLGRVHDRQGADLPRWP